MNGDEDRMKGIIVPAVAVAMLAGSLIAVFTVVAARAQSSFSGQEHGTPHLPTFFADDSTVVPGGEADVTYRIEGTDGNVAGLAVQIDFDGERVVTLGTCEFGPRQGQPCEYQPECGDDACRGGCRLDPRLTEQGSSFHPAGPGVLQIIIIGDFYAPGSTFAVFGDGPLFTCTFRARPEASIGPVPLTHSVFSLSNPEATPILGTAVDGFLFVVEPTLVPTPLPTPRVDLDGDGAVGETDLVSLLEGIFDPVGATLDVNHDGRVTSADLVAFLDPGVAPVRVMLSDVLITSGETSEMTIVLADDLGVVAAIEVDIALPTDGVDVESRSAGDDEICRGEDDRVVCLLVGCRLAPRLEGHHALLRRVRQDRLTLFVSDSMFPGHPLGDGPVFICELHRAGPPGTYAVGARATAYTADGREVSDPLVAGSGLAIILP